MSDSESSEENLVNPTDGSLEEIEKKFKEMVVAWVKLDDGIRAMSEELKEMKSEKKQYEEYILAIMEKMEEDTVTLSNGMLKKNVTQSKGALKEELIQDAIKEITKDADKAYEITQYIIQKRPTSEKVSLKRTIRRERKSKAKGKKSA